MLVLSWHFNAATMCEFSRDEFVKGMTSLRCDSIRKLQQKLPGLRAELQDDKKFKVCSGDHHDRLFACVRWFCCFAGK